MSVRRSPPTLAAALYVGTLVIGAPPLHAQIRLGLRAGVVTSSHLLRDSIIEPISVVPHAAVFVGAMVDAPFERRYRVGVALSVGRSDVVSRTAEAENVATTLTLWHPSLTLSRQLMPWFSVEVNAGALIYRPRERTGTIFRDGGPVDPVVGLTVAMTRRLGGALLAAVEFGYDLHRFSTSTLQTFGFMGKTTVHRVAFGLSVRRIHARAARDP